MPLIIEKARSFREDNPGLGSTKLYRIVKELFYSTGCMPGRDAFIEILRANGLMVKIRRRRHYKTTDSHHNFHKYPNLIRDVIPSRPNEIWVSDITYVETSEGVCYLSLKSIPPKTACRLIHHSDRGVQYCSSAYVQELECRGISISMTESGDPLENAIAERANGILKREWLYKMNIANRAACTATLVRIIDFYNNQRPHMSLGWQTPSAAHSQSGPQKKCWRAPWEVA